MRHIKKWIKRTIALVLALTLIAASAPQSALTVSAAEATAEVEGETAPEEAGSRAAELTAAEEVEKVSEPEPEKPEAAAEETTETDIAQAEEIESETEQASESEAVTETEAEHKTESGMEEESGEGVVSNLTDAETTNAETMNAETTDAETMNAETTNAETTDAAADKRQEYTVTLDWDREEAEVFALEDGSDYVKLESGEIKAVEGYALDVYVKPLDSEKGVFVAYTENGETIVPRYEYDGESGRYHYFIAEDGISSDDISVKISVVDFCMVTLKAVSNDIESYHYSYGKNDDICGDFASVNECVSETVERECSFKMPAGYELRFNAYNRTEYGSLTAATEKGALTKKELNDRTYFAYTPAEDVVITLDVKPAEFIFDVDEGVEFSVCRYDSDQDAYVDVALSEQKSIFYCDAMDGLRLKIKKEEGKRYEVNGEFEDAGDGTRIEYMESLGEEDEEYAQYKLNIGSCKKAIIRSYGTVVMDFAQDAAENSGEAFTVTTGKAYSSSEISETGLSVILSTKNNGYDSVKGGYTYTGSAVTPEATVYYAGYELINGVDYTVKYSNNVNVSTTAKTAKVTITGKGSLTGSYDKAFKITPKNIGNYDVKAGSIKVAKNTKAAPVLVYNGILLTAKDYDNPKAGIKFYENDVITITGKGNFEGSRTISVKVVEKRALNKISIKLDNSANKNLTYDGTQKKPAFTVLDADKNPIPKSEEGKSYTVVYPQDIVSAGTVKFTVIGMGDYTGSVTQSYKIKPSAAWADSITVSEPSKYGYDFVSTGVTGYYPDVSINNAMLTEGRDYTLSYSNNKKVGTAKCKISFIGNYKGIKAITKTFTITPLELDSMDIMAFDQNSGGKPGIYKSTPYFIERDTGVLLKASAFKLTYYVTDDPYDPKAVEMKGSAGKIASGTVWVKIEPKNANYTGVRYVDYNVINDSIADLSKAKVTLTPNKVSYTGYPIWEGDVVCRVECNGKTVYDSKTLTNYGINVRYVNNINKGKATVIVTGKGEGYTGSKIASFTIAAASIKY